MDGLHKAGALTYQQKQISQTVSDSVDTMPRDIADLIGAYTAGDFILAIRKIALDEAGNPTTDDLNNRTIAAIKEALISKVCPEMIKLQVMKNIAFDPIRIQVFNQIIAEIAEAGYQANIDHLNLSFLRLPGLNWAALSSKNVVFNLTPLRSSGSIEGADLTGAILS